MTQQTWIQDEIEITVNGAGLFVAEVPDAGPIMEETLEAAREAIKTERRSVKKRKPVRVPVLVEIDGCYVPATYRGQSGNSTRKAKLTIDGEKVTEESVRMIPADHERADEILALSKERRALKERDREIREIFHDVSSPYYVRPGWGSGTGHAETITKKILKRLGKDRGTS